MTQTYDAALAAEAAALVENLDASAQDRTLPFTAQGDRVSVGSTLLKVNHPGLNAGSFLAGENGAYRNLTAAEIAAGTVTI